MKISLDMDTKKLKTRLEGVIGQTQIELDNQVLKDSNFYAPQVEGFLQDSSLTASQIGKGILVWNTPYAKAQYYSLPNKATDKNPNAQMRWFEVAKSHNKKNWLLLANKRFKK